MQDIASQGSPAWGQPVPIQTPGPAPISFTLALTGPDADVLMPSERAAIQSTIAQAIPSVSESPLLQFRSITDHSRHIEHASCLKTSYSNWALPQRL